MEPRHPAVDISLTTKGGKGEMTRTPINLQDLRKRIYIKAKADKAWRFWGSFDGRSKPQRLRLEQVE